MSDTDLKAKTETDWASKLREQLQQEDVSSDESTSREDDPAQTDLNSLLRDQLAKLREARETPRPAPTPVAVEEEAEESEELEEAEKSEEWTEDEPEVIDEVETEIVEDEPEVVDEVEPEIVEDKPEVIDEAEDEIVEDELEPEIEEVESEIAAMTEPEAIEVESAPVVARDDELNGVPVADLLDSGAFFRGLDPETSRQVRAIWEKHTTSLPTPAPFDEGDDEAEEESEVEVVEIDPSHGVISADRPAPAPVWTPIPRSDPLQIDLDTTPAPADEGFLSESRTPDADTPTPQTAPEMPLGTEHPPLHRKKISVNAAPKATPAHEPIPEVPDTPENTRITREQGDAELFIDLGYENELRRTPDGAAEADKVYRSRLRAERVGTRNTISPAYAGKEYAGSAMTPSVERGFRSALRLSVLRLSVAAIGCLIGFWYDILPFWESSGSYTSLAYPLVGALLMLLFALPSIKRLGLGLRSLWDMEPVRYAVPAMALLVSILHTLVSIATVGQESRPPLFCGAALLILTLTCLCDLLSTRTQLRSFRIVSSGRARMTVTIMSSPRPDADATDDLADELTGDAEDTLTLRLCRTSRIPNFFALANRYNGRLAQLNYLMPAALLLAIAAGGVAMLTGGELLADALPRFTATYLACMPGAMLLSLLLPYCIGNRLLGEKGCTVIGEATPEQYAPATHTDTRVILPDGFALRPFLPNEITVRNDPRSAEWLDMAHRLFALLDCPLAGFGEPIRRAELSALRLELAERDDECLRFYMTDSRTGVSVEALLGSYEALAARSVRLPDRALEASYKRSPDAQVLYVAFDRHFRLACASDLRVDSLFRLFSERLQELGCRVSLLSYSPLADSSLLVLSDDAPSVGLFCPKQYSRAYSPRSGGLVSVRDGLEVLRAYLVCRLIRKANTYGVLFSWLWFSIVGILAATSALLELPIQALPWLCCLVQVVAAGLSCLPALILLRRSRMTVSKPMGKKK